MVDGLSLYGPVSKLFLGARTLDIGSGVIINTDWPDIRDINKYYKKISLQYNKNKNEFCGKII